MTTEVNKDKIVNLWRYNVPQIVTSVLSAGGAVIACVWAISLIRTDVTVNSNDILTLKSAYSTRQAYVDGQISAMNSQIRELPNLTYRITTAEANIDSIGKRIDSILTQINTSVEGIRKDLGNLTTKVEVQSNKIDTMSKKMDQLSGGKITFSPTALSLETKNFR